MIIKKLVMVADNKNQGGVSKSWSKSGNGFSKLTRRLDRQTNMEKRIPEISSSVVLLVNINECMEIII